MTGIGEMDAGEAISALERTRVRLDEEYRRALTRRGPYTLGVRDPQAAAAELEEEIRAVDRAITTLRRE